MNDLTEENEQLSARIDQLEEEIVGLNVACEDQEQSTLDSMELSKRLRTELDKAEVELNRVRYDGPRGNWKCPECDFFAVVQAINVNTGTVGVPRIQEVPKCSNNCGPMRPLTWKEACANQDAGYKRLNEVMDDREEQLKKLKDGLRNNNTKFDMALLDAYIENFKTIKRERDDWRAIAEHNHGICVDMNEELVRLKKGDFTKEEIHEFCHKLAETVPREEFEQGCKNYQDKLYGLPSKGG